ncbi:MAG TPA: sulfotransferase [Steroidobacteraceae bacterium]|jgi:tetratricopeptide (TPR) repeat protein|nr:sulfotransferase [Steroidobacteraceae bacterium]
MSAGPTDAPAPADPATVGGGADVPPPANPPPPSPIEAEVKRIRGLLERSQFAPALEAGQALRSQVPLNRDVLYMIAVALRYLGRIPEALAALAELEKHHPKYSRLFQERGHCHVATRSAGPAIEAFVHAVNLNSALSGSWRALEVLFRMTGREADSRHAAAEAQKLAELPHELMTAFNLYADGNIVGAEHQVRQYLLAHGDHIEGMRLLAKIGMDLDVIDDAELLLEAVVARQPEYHAARYEYALALLRRHKHVEAREQMEQLLAVDPDNRAYRTTHATICTGFGNYDLALPLYREILKETPEDAELHLSIAHALKTLGRTDEAVASYREAAAVRPHYGEAYWSLANLKTYRFSEAEIRRMRDGEAAGGIEAADRYHLCFALGKALEDRGEYAESFSFYERGNVLKKAECRYRPEPLERNARLQADVCTREFFAAREGLGAKDRSPIFIVGLPRSGSTLIEQILASHSRVEGTMELADIPRLVQDLRGRDTEDSGSGPRYPGVLAELTAPDFERLGRKYLDDTRVYRQGRPYFIDKMPNNFRHLGLIHLMLPNARIIDARRGALACCFSNYKQLFASGQQFTYDIEDIARYYRMYVELMAHWDEALPGRILRIHHEALVDDLESHVRRLLDFCELPFEPACVEFHKTGRSVHSASSEQVRRPINREGIDHWRHFGPWLAPLEQALGPLAEEHG